MSKALEKMRADIYVVVAQEVIKDLDAPVDEIAKRIKTRVDELLQMNGITCGFPLEHAKNLVRRKLKEIELECNLGDPYGKDDVLREELRQIGEDIKKTRPEFAIVEASFSKN